MKKSKFIKGLAGVGLACVSALSVAGCADLKIEQSKVDTLIEKGETFVDTQNDIDYKKLAEELQKYLDENNNKLSSSDIKQKMAKDVLNLIKLYTSQNYLYQEGSKFTRVEYVSDALTKVYHYNVKDNNEKTNEVYREILRSDSGQVFVKTYVKELNLYSYNSARFDREDVSLLEFHLDENIAFINSDTKIYWENIFDKNNKSISSGYFYNSDVGRYLFDMYEMITNMSISDFESLMFIFSFLRR